MKDNALLVVGFTGIILCFLFYLGFKFDVGGVPSWFLRLFNVVS